MKGKRHLTTEERLLRLEPKGIRYLEDLVNGKLKKKEKGDAVRLAGCKYVLGYALGRKGKRESYEEKLEKEG